MDAEVKKSLPGLALLAFTTFVSCVPAAFTQIISLDVMLDLNSFPSNDYAWSFPIFVAGECAAMGLCAGFIDRAGRRNPYLIGSLLFIFATAGCALAPDMNIFNIFRLLEGLGTGIIIVTCIAQIFFDVTDRKERYMANGIMSAGFGTGMLFGLFAGKAVVDTIGWDTAFWAIAVVQAIITYPCLQVLSNGKRSEMKADALGAVILAVFIGFFVFFLEKLYLDWNGNMKMIVLSLIFLVMLFLLLIVVELLHPNSMFQRTVNNSRLVKVSMVFILILGVFDMAAVGFMVKISLFTYQMSVLEAAPYFLVMIGGAAVTALSISHFIDRTGHLPWLLLSIVLSPIALLSMYLVSADDPTFMFAAHLFILGLAIGCLVSMLNATIQNRTNENNNGAYMSFAIMARTAALWLGYNFYQSRVDSLMKEEIGGIVAYWNEVLPFPLPSDSTLANLLITPLMDVVKMIPGLTDDIATIYAAGVANGFTYSAIAFVVIGLPTALTLYKRGKAL